MDKPTVGAFAAVGAEAEQSLRLRASALLRQGHVSIAESLLQRPDASRQDLAEGLRVYQAEVEAQADELRESRIGLEQSAARFESLFQSLPVPVLALDVHGFVLHANRACQSAFAIGGAREPHRAFARWLRRVEDALRVREALQNARLGRSSSLLGVHLLRGREAVVCDLAFERLSAEAEGDLVMVTLVDQTERLDALRHLQGVNLELTRQQGENRRLAEAVRLTGQSVIVTDAQRRITWVNEAFTQLSGYSIEEALGRTPGALLQGQSTDPDAKRRLSELLRAGLPVDNFELVNVAKDGRPYWVQLNIRPVHDEHGAVVEFVAMQTDISRRREAEEALRRSEAQQRAIFEAEPHALTLLRRDGGLVRSNAAAVALFGLAEGDDRSNLRQFVSPADAAAFDRLMASAVLGHSQELRFTLVCGDGSSVPAQMHTVPLFRDGRVDGVLAVTRDIRDELAAQDLRVRHGVAEAASRAKSDFIARMSHELRTPLNAMIGFAQLLQRGLGTVPVERQREHLSHVLGAGWHLLAMINDLLDLSRIESDRIAVACLPSALTPIAEHAIALVQPLAEQHGIRITRLGLAPAALALVDPLRLSQVLSNLLSNAIKYNHPHGWVELRIGMDGDAPWMEVADGGPGLSAEQRAHLFEPFNRLGAERTAVEGTGIGLVIARRLTELMDGRLSLMDSEGVGAVFRLRLAPVPAGEPQSVPAPFPAPLPLVATDVGPTAAVPQPAPHPGDVSPLPEAGSSQARTVLYVEDDEVNIVLLRAILDCRPDWRVIEARSGAEGQAQVRLHAPDLLLLDMQLPDMTGLQLRESMLRDPATAHIPCLLLTADATEETRRQALDRGFVDVQLKPVHTAGLVAAMDRAVLPEPKP